MSLLDILQNSPTLLPIADAVAKATLLLAAATVVTAALRKSSAAARHLVWTCALLAAVALPVLSFALPRWQMPIVTIASDAAVPVEAVESGFPPAEAPNSKARSSKAGAASPAERMARRPLEPEARPTSPEVEEGASSLLSGLSWPTILFSIWAAGALLIAVRLAVAIAAVGWLSRRTQTAIGAPWLELAREIAAQLGVSRVTFRRSLTPAMPMAWGIFKPSVLMPAEADAWPHDRLRVVLLHELAHVRRADCLTHMLAQAACALYWFNPLAWMAARRLRAERERACDDLVLAFGTPGPDYADQLLEIARAMGSGRLSTAMAGASLAMARRSQLEGRLMSILDPSVPRNGVSRARTAAVAAFAIVAIAPLASVQPWVHAAPAVIPQLPVRQTLQVQVPPVPPQTGEAIHQTSKVEQKVEQKVAQETVVQRVVEGVSQGAVQGATQGIVQGVTQGAIQGVTQGAIQGALQGVLQSAPNAVSNAVEGAMGQTPNPNPNPNPNPIPGGEDQPAKADPKVVAALTAALKDTDKEVRESAMQALVRLRDPGIFEPLVQALKDVSPDVRENAAFGLGQLEDKRAVAPLTAALKDAAPGVRERAVFALGRLEDPATVDAIVTVLRDENASVREQAAFALGQIEDERAVQPLISAVKDPSANVREQAVFALGQIESRAAVDALIGATKDAEANVREQAVFALGQIGDPKAIDALTVALKDASANVRQQAAFALGQLAK